MRSGSRTESRKTSVSSSATRPGDATSSAIGTIFKTHRKEPSGGSKEQENNQKRPNSQPKVIPLRDARDRLGEHFKTLRIQLVHPLFANAIIPVKKYQAIERMKLALEDFAAKLKIMDVTDKIFEQVLAIHEKAKVEEKENLRQSERNLLAATGKMKQRTEEWEESMNKFCEESGKVSIAGAGSFGARGCLDEEQDNKNKEFVRFCGTVTDYVISRCENLGDITVALCLVDNACSALKDWSEIYDWRAIQKVKQDLDEYGRRWFWEKLNGNWRDRSVTVRENIIEEAKAESVKIQEEAEKLKVQGKGKDKHSDAERRLNNAMQEMQKIYEASQKASEKKTSRWHRYLKPGTVQQAQ
ncbi:hypothetical protein ACEPAI_1566 [Sanghuangporus weigelae]